MGERLAWTSIWRVNLLTGECFCGKVRYQIDGDLNGSITQGKQLVDKVGHDGHHRYHCSTCHCWVYGDSEEYPGMKFIPCGTLNEPPEQAPTHHVCVDSKASWVTINDDLPQYPGMQPKQLLENQD
jgi:hypothetical protein